jgi:hypothetical protein
VNEDVWSLVIKNIYNIRGRREDYIKPTVDGDLIWISIKYYETNFEDALNRWQNKLYEFSTHKCARITKEV